MPSNWFRLSYWLMQTSRMLEWQLSWPTLPAEYWVSQTLGQTNRNGNVCSEWVALRWKSDFKSCWEAKAQFQFQSHAKLDEFQNKYLHSHTYSRAAAAYTLTHTHTHTLSRRAGATLHAFLISCTSKTVQSCAGNLLCHLGVAPKKQRKCKTSRRRKWAGGGDAGAG